jgi:hypothetical protein
MLLKMHPKIGIAATVSIRPTLPTMLPRAHGQASKITAYYVTHGNRVAPKNPSQAGH